MTSNAENGWELSVTRDIAAPPEKVWEIMTKRQEEWWCPVPWRAEVVAQDWRAGGRSEMVFKGPDGEEMPQEGVFLEVTPRVRFVSTDAFKLADDGSFNPSEPFMIGTWQIEPNGDGTRYTAFARHWKEETYKQHLEMGFVDGWGACADQLKALAEAG